MAAIPAIRSPVLSMRAASSVPPLTQIANRIHIAGVLTNTPDNLIEWIQNPPGVDPRTAMPNLGVDQTAARDIAAYLYTLR